MSQERITLESRAVITEAASALFTASPALQLATTGGPYSPWVLGVYFAHEAKGDLGALTFFLETSGKTFANVKVEPRVAFLISNNDAQQDFVQGTGTLELLPASEQSRVNDLLVAKMPWYKTYTPVVPVRLTITELFVSSFQRGWFPARHLQTNHQANA